MAFWRGETIAANPRVVSPFDAAHVKENAYNLAMGAAYFTTSPGGASPPVKQSLAPGQCFPIPPGQFAVLITSERVNIPDNCMAFISMRSLLKYNGLINVSGFHVDPGYSGRLIFSVYNASPSSLQICEGERVFKIWFCYLDDRSDSAFLYRGAGVSDIDSALIRGMSGETLTLQNVYEDLRSLRNSVETKFAEQKPTIDHLSNLWHQLTIGLVLALAGLVLAFLGPIAWGYGQLLYKWLTRD